MGGESDKAKGEFGRISRTMLAGFNMSRAEWNPTKLWNTTFSFNFHDFWKEAVQEAILSVGSCLRSIKPQEFFAAIPMGSRLVTSCLDGRLKLGVVLAYRKCRSLFSLHRKSFRFEATGRKMKSKAKGQLWIGRVRALDVVIVFPGQVLLDIGFPASVEVVSAHAASSAQGCPMLHTMRRG